MKRKNLIIGGGGLVLVFLLVLCGLIKKSWNGKDDIKFGIIADNGIEIIVVSPKRRMINYLTIGENVEVWIPKGLSWYKANRIKKILRSEKKENLGEEIFLYNFGYGPDKILYLEKISETDSERFWFDNLGFWGWMRLVGQRDEMVTKKEKIESSLENAGGILDEVMLRDFADNRVLASENKLNVINASDISGLANFVGEKLGWMGITINSLENGEKYDGVCELKTNEETGIVLELLKRKFWECGFSKSSELSEGEIELVLGEKYASSIDYDSFVKH